jgi:GNAT superfamily N-acetyltransferase
VIRRATPADICAIVELGRAMHAESPTHSRLSFSDARVTQLVASMIARPLTALVLVSENDGAIDAGALAHIEPHWYSEDLVAQELAVYVAPNKRGTLRAARLVASIDAWARAMGAKLLQAGCTTGVAVNRTIELYEHLGFSRVAIGVERVYH